MVKKCACNAYNYLSQSRNKGLINYNVEFDYARIKWLNQVNYNIYFHHIKRGKYYGRNIIM